MESSIIMSEATWCLCVCEWWAGERERRVGGEGRWRTLKGLCLNDNNTNNNPNSVYWVLTKRQALC